MKQAMKDHVQLIQATIKAAKADGFDITLENRCCGCSRMTLEISAKEDTFGSDSVVIMEGV